MLGLGSLEMALAYWSCLIGGIFCVWWGWRRWNAPSEPDRLRYKKYIHPSRSGAQTGEGGGE